MATDCIPIPVVRRGMGVQGMKNTKKDHGLRKSVFHRIRKMRESLARVVVPEGQNVQNDFLKETIPLKNMSVFMRKNEQKYVYVNTYIATRSNM
jgi:hypothetical protein